MKFFEEDVARIVSNIEFKHVKDPFLNNIAEDLKKVNSSQNVFVLADKTRNLYETAPDEYNKLVSKKITKTYKLGVKNLTDDINSELQKITSKISIGDRVDTMATRKRVNEVILDDINNKIRSILKVNQWRNSSFVIGWLKSINKKPNHTFISSDIVEFYPSITADLLDDAIAWAKPTLMMIIYLSLSMQGNPCCSMAIKCK